MKEELFKKVYIRSEADLPKEDDRYCVFMRCINSTEMFAFDSKLPFNKKRWLDDIYWYLQPIEQEQPKETKSCENCKYLDNEDHGYPCKKCDEDFCMWQEQQSSPKDKIPFILNEQEKKELDILRIQQSDSNTFMSSEQYDRLLELVKREFGFNMGCKNKYGNLFQQPNGKVIQGGLNGDQSYFSQVNESLPEDEKEVYCLSCYSFPQGYQLPSDEDWNKFALTFENVYHEPFGTDSLFAVKNFIKNQIKAIDLRDELIGFINWYSFKIIGKVPDIVVPFVDEYLKQK